MNKNFFEHINIDINNTFVPNGCAVDLAGEGKRYDEHIADLGGIDLQLLGIGLDGHIGFNEPDKYFVKSTHVVDLHESTIKANSRFFANIDEVPKRAITMGIRCDQTDSLYNYNVIVRFKKPDNHIIFIGGNQNGKS